MENKKENTIILFQGDSVSDGNRYKDPIARDDLNHQIGHTFIYIIAGTMGLKYADKHISFINRGVSGDNIEQIYDRREEDIFAEHPDVFSILVGMNDYWLWKDDPEHTQEFEEIYRQLLDEVLEHNPETKLILCEPFILPVKLEEDVYKARHKMVIITPYMFRLQTNLKRCVRYESPAIGYGTVFIRPKQVMELLRISG